MSLVGQLRDRMRMLREDALAVSKVVEEAFQGESELDDERLDPHLRQVFYDLQDERILDVRRVELRDPKGAPRRHYMWRVRTAEVAAAEPARAAEDLEARLYHRLPDSTWERRLPDL